MKRAARALLHELPGMLVVVAIVVLVTLALVLFGWGLLLGGGP